MCSKSLETYCHLGVASSASFVRHTPPFAFAIQRVQRPFSRQSGSIATCAIRPLKSGVPALYTPRSRYSLSSPWASVGPSGFQSLLPPLALPLTFFQSLRAFWTAAAGTVSPGVASFRNSSSAPRTPSWRLPGGAKVAFAASFAASAGASSSVSMAGPVALVPPPPVISPPTATAVSRRAKTPTATSRRRMRRSSICLPCLEVVVAGTRSGRDSSFRLASSRVTISALMLLPERSVASTRRRRSSSGMRSRKRYLSPDTRSEPYAQVAEKCK